MGTGLFIAADGGGTKTDFALFSEDGRVVARRTLGGASPTVRGFDAACATLAEGLDAMKAAAGGARVRGAFAGVAGALAGGNAARMAAALAGRHPGLVVESDVMNVVFGAARPGKCVAAIAGTGSSVFGYDGSRLVRAGGWGYLFDGAGGGYDIGRDVVRLCLETEEDARAERLPIVRRAEERLGGRAIDRLPVFYEKGADFLASFAPIAFDLAREGDDLARRIVRRSAARLAELILAVRSRCDCGDVALVAGGLLAARDVFLPMLEDALSGLVRVETPALPPIFGASRRCLALHGAKPSADFLENFRASCGAPPDAPARPARGLPAAAAGGGVSATEQRNPRSTHIDEMDVVSMLRLANDENARSVEAVGGALGAVARAVEAVSDALAKGGRLFYVGAGTSGRLAVQDAAECPPTYGVGDGVVVANIAGGEGAVFHAVEQVEDSAEAGRGDLERRGVAAADVVMGVSASGNAAYVAAALECAKALGCRTISLSSNRACRIAEIADIAIFVDTGAEVVTGSTRMKAGNAQKMVMNMITTCAMVRTGKVYENLMVNLRPANQKLRRRMVGIVSQIAGVPAGVALAALETGGFDIRDAVRRCREGGKATQGGGA